MRVVLVVVVMLAAGCVTTRDHGHGSCTEYKPFMCWQGQMVCELDEKGCQLCTCREGGSTPPRRPPDSQP